MTAAEATKRLKALASPEVVTISARFFKTGPGQYGAGDVFIGVRVPALRKLACDFRDMPLGEVEVLLHSPIHEERLLALLILVAVAAKADEVHKQTIFNFYLSNTRYINNWDLVDRSAPALFGAYLKDKSRNRPARRACTSDLRAFGWNCDPTFDMECLSLETRKGTRQSGSSTENIVLCIDLDQFMGYLLSKRVDMIFGWYFAMVIDRAECL